jgi:GT2 family glycosyltransferase
MEVTVAIGTFGDMSWRRLARERAIPSVEAEGVNWVHVHADSLHQARNASLEEVETEWVIHLDADDELEPGYVKAMGDATADVRAPSVRYVRRNRPRQPGMPKVAGHEHDCTSACFPQGNWVAIGAAVRAQLVRDVGGWEDFAVYEDWALWLRCWKAGATFEAVPEAVYRAHVRMDSRNRGREIEFKNRVHHEIVAACL